jgi:Spy/CpxP family protein refolding chaperone
MNRSRSVTLLLTVSLALNLAFLAAFFYQRTRRPPLPAPPEFKSDFGLSAEQDARVRGIVRKFKINSILFREDILDKRVEIIEELGREQGDREKIAARIEELNSLENQLNRDFIAALLQIGDILEPEQRLDMIYRLSRNWFFFDRDGKKGGPHE